MRKTILLLLLSIIGLTACSVDSSAVPLADNKPTFLFFYTDG